MRYYLKWGCPVDFMVTYGVVKINYRIINVKET